MKLIDDINSSIEIEQKSSHADKLYNGISLSSGGVACALLLSALITLLVDFSDGVFAVAVVFYPIAVLLVVAYIFGIAELLRNRYFTSILSIAVSSATLLISVLTVVLLIVLHGVVPLFPFVL